MSKNVSIEEGDRARNFGPTAKIKTELQQGGYCYWVPEDERETGMVFASTNRKYTPDEIGKYGIDEIDINIIFTGVDPDGNPWIVTIDPDIELPIIIYPTDDVDIDPDTGLPIPPIPPIKIPGIVIEIDPDTGDVIIEEIPDPDKDPDDWPGWDDIDPSIKEDFDDWMGDLDPVPIADIDDGILDDMGFDPESDLDMSLDDLGDVGDVGDLDIAGIDTDGNDMVVDLDLDTGEWDTGDCPASIQVMHVPDKTSYNDGEAINLDGLVIQAYDADGNPWSSSEYPDGYIPAHELNGGQKYADYNSGSSEYDIPTYSDSISNITSNGSISQLIDLVTSCQSEEMDKSYKESYDESVQSIYGDLPSGYENSAGYVWSEAVEIPAGSSGYTFNPVLTIFIFDSLPAQIDPDGSYSGTMYEYRFQWSYTGEASYWGPWTSTTSRKLFQGEKDGEISTINMAGTGRRINEYNVSWTSPCLKTFETSLSIAVSPPKDYGGSHYSGKF